MSSDSIFVNTATTGGFFGSSTPEHFYWCLFFAFLGVFLSLNMEANKRDVFSTKSPLQFSYRAMLKMNWQRILFNIVAIYVVMRFSNDITGKPLSEFWSLAIGLGVDRFVLLLKKLKDVFPSN